MLCGGISVGGFVFTENGSIIPADNWGIVLAASAVAVVFGVATVVVVGASVAAFVLVVTVVADFMLFSAFNRLRELIESAHAIDEKELRAKTVVAISVALRHDVTVCLVKSDLVRLGLEKIWLDIYITLSYVLCLV